MIVIFILSLVSMVASGPSTESFKYQFCTDPRTMKKHAAYTEWADAYSCTRHRCQPGGRNLAIYTVGCKRVEAPESAIECEEVVEDTNMQFPYCCTRLRCLVVVRGEVWTRVLGQPWETLPAAPWSHMYKMKRPPPADGSFLPKTVEAGPVYELSEPETHEKVLRSSKTTEAPDCNDLVPRSIPAPDIVIALSTNSEQKDDRKNPENLRHKRVRKTTATSSALYNENEYESDTPLDMHELDDAPVSTEKPVELRADTSSDERFFANSNSVTPKVKVQTHQLPWTEIPQSQWNEHDAVLDTDINKDGVFHQSDFTSTASKEPPPSNLQSLVDAIGTRMRDIETVVLRMSEKVHDATPQDMMTSSEKRSLDGEDHKRQKTEAKDHKVKKPSPDTDHYKRFSVRNRGSKYLHTTEGTTEAPLFVEDTNMNGYFSDASNGLVRRSNGPKEPAQTYMAPVETRRKHNADSSDDTEKKHKKHSHKKKKSKHGHKKHHGQEEKRKRFNKISSTEIDKNALSLEDSSAA